MAAAKPGANICLSCGMNFKTGQKMETAAGIPAPARRASAVPGRAAPVGAAGAPGRAGPKVLGYVPRNTRGEAAVVDEGKQKLQMLIAPAICFVIGLALTYLTYVSYYKYSLAVASMAVTINLAVSMVMIFIGCLVGIKLLNFSLGSPQDAALKIAAVALLPTAISTLIGWQFGVAGGMVGWGVSLMVTWAMLMMFFDLDGMDVYILSTIIWILQTWVVFILIAILMSAIAGGGSMMNTGAMGFLSQRHRRCRRRGDVAG